MKIVAISDIHGNAAGIDRLSPVLESADLVLVSGDITNFGGRREAAAVLDRLSKHAGRVLAGKALADSVSGLSLGAPLVILSHQPPFGTKADQVRGGRNVGSRTLRKFLEERQPLACFCGHIHESPGLDSIGETRVANPGPLPQGGYVWAEWEGGGLKVELKSVR
jgi:Icc-related predicted phosphoesterase